MSKFTTAGELYSLDAKESHRQANSRLMSDRNYGKPGMKVLKFKYFPRDRVMFAIIDRDDDFLFKKELEG
ncbi:hypothetical protein CHUUTOTORO_01550 [Serratia phage vB_SmaM-ChuuTotoro]|nr:hypothetical protein CHUUTOTORO_01550 [Serratia phage vB_SmaM-ChuuTotoro]